MLRNQGELRTLLGVLDIELALGQRLGEVRRHVDLGAALLNDLITLGGLLRESEARIGCPFSRAWANTRTP